LPLPDIVELDSIDRFSELIDVRSPAEFADDCIPGARNFPVLDDAERAEVGTVNAQVSPFAARRRGAVLVARNIARHIEAEFDNRPPDWHPLIYCWRGGKRSHAMAVILSEIGWRASVLRGGYKTYRRRVLDELTALPPQLHYVVVCGETGSAKSRLLAALADHGAQILDLEGLARHRGSVLGDIPLAPQPSQRGFETLLGAALRGLDPAAPVFVESESRKIGNLQVPDGLIAAMRASPCVRISAPLQARVRHLLAEYRRFVDDPAALNERIDLLADRYPSELIERWKTTVGAGRAAEFVAEILERHYDPAYRRSMARNFPGLEASSVFELEALSDEELRGTAQALISEHGRPAAPSCGRGRSN
jgi:tRNA 2-selenouridine synthase